jgi:hypothetical protein
MRNPLLLGAAVLLISGGIAAAQIATPPAQEGPASGQNFRGDRLQSDRDSAMVPTPTPRPSAPETTGQTPRNKPDPNPLPGEEPRPIPR